jgi:hypothetical protein
MFILTTTGRNSASKLLAGVALAVSVCMRLGWRSANTVMDDILKNYSRKLFSDEVEYILGYDPELGFNPYYWVVQGEHDKSALPDLPRAGGVAAGEDSVE